jgi:hypothetical protein
MKFINTAFLAVCQRHRSAPAPTGPDRHPPALTRLDRHKTGTDRPGLFYDDFDTHFVLNSQKRYDILKILIKYVIKQPGPVGACLVPVQSGQGRSVPAGAGADWYRSGPFGADWYRYRRR